MATDAGLPAAYDALVEDLLEQINLGRSYEELFDRIYDGLQGIVPYHRIAVALLLEPGDRLGPVSCRSDGPPALKIGYADPIAGSTLEPLLRTGQPRIINDLPAYLADKSESRSTRLIVREVPTKWQNYIQLNTERSAALKDADSHITKRQEPRLGAGCKVA
jgi:hypothetical protein